jgi:hypothetical protein
MGCSSSSSLKVLGTHNNQLSHNSDSDRFRLNTNLPSRGMGAVALAHGYRSFSALRSSRLHPIPPVASVAECHRVALVLPAGHQGQALSVIERHRAALVVLAGHHGLGSLAPALCHSLLQARPREWREHGANRHASMLPRPLSVGVLHDNEGEGKWRRVTGDLEAWPAVGEAEMAGRAGSA